LELVELERDVVEQQRLGDVRSVELTPTAAPAQAPQHVARLASLNERVAMLIVALTAVVTTGAAVAASSVVRTVADEPVRVGTLVALTLMLQMFSVQVYGRGSVSVSAIGILTSAFLLNTGSAMAIAMVAALAQWLRRRGQLHKAVFDASNFAVSAAAASLIFHALPQTRLLAAVAAGLTYAAINNGLLCLVMSFAENCSWRTVWSERFHWARFHFALFGPLALAGAIAYEQIGATGLAAFALPPALMILSVRQYLERTTAAVEEIRQANIELRRAHRDTIAALSRSMEAKDTYTGGHTERVARLAVALARELGYRNEDLEAIEMGALLHDIGKISVPEQILLKKGPLDDSEWEVMKAHPLVSDYILSELDLHPSIRECARSSHERIDGCGYPDGLAGEEIPLPARIVLVADAFDALTTTRPYRAARPGVEAVSEIRANAGTQFCPRVVDALVRLWGASPHFLEAVPQGRERLQAELAVAQSRRGRRANDNSKSARARRHSRGRAEPDLQLEPVSGAESAR
jgi:putative nucleotidyltransferase with HDIG domain